MPLCNVCTIFMCDIAFHEQVVGKTCLYLLIFKHRKDIEGYWGSDLGGLDNFDNSHYY